MIRLQATELLGLCAPGEGGPFALGGATRRDGAVPVKASGGLQSKGHPLAATGLGMIGELVLQLRGEAGAAPSPAARSSRCSRAPAASWRSTRRCAP